MSAQAASYTTCERDNEDSWKPAWQLQADGHWQRLESAGHKAFRAQDVLCQRALEQEAQRAKALPRELKPQKPR